MNKQCSLPRECRGRVKLGYGKEASKQASNTYFLQTTEEGTSQNMEDKQVSEDTYIL
jgi:hypothetical protein